MISIIIPVFNSNSTIPKTITSVQNQIFQDFEVIIVNDGSTDNTLETVNQLIKNDARFSIINQKNSGVSTARNIGIKKAKYNIIAFLDSDDEWHDDYLEKIASLIDTFPHCIGFVTLYRRCLRYGNENLKITNKVEDNSVIKISSVTNQLINGGLPFFTSCIVFKKNILIETGMFHEKINCGEDLLMWIKASLKGEIAILSKICANYNITIKANGKLRRKNDPIDFFHIEIKKLKGNLTQSQINHLLSDWFYARYLNSLVTQNRIINFRSIMTEYLKMIHYKAYTFKRLFLLVLFFFPSSLIDKELLYKK